MGNNFVKNSNLDENYAGRRKLHNLAEMVKSSLFFPRPKYKTT